MFAEDRPRRRRSLELSLLPEGSVDAGFYRRIKCRKPKMQAVYYVEDDRDAVDLLVGSDGTLGVMTEIDCILIPHPRLFGELVLFSW
jgi:D-lactate dehydrogenase (cytochrome)